MSATTVEARIRQFGRPTWAEISLSALRENFRRVKRHVGQEVSVCTVVKADAYGHGAAQCALALESEGAKWLGVTTTDEGVPLRDAGVRTRILLMTGFWRGEEEEVIRRNLTAAVWEPWHVKDLDQAGSRLGVGPQPVHLKVDTGMGRLGVSLEELPSMCKLIHGCPHISVEGVFTHLASSEVLDAPDVTQQLERFEQALRRVKAEGLSPSLCHMDNTGGMISRPKTWRDMVRPGLALYGYTLPLVQNGQVVNDTPPFPLRPVLSWRTRIISIRQICAGQALGYNGTFVTKAPSRIAVLPVGYADGYNRELSNRGHVIIRGAYAPIVGNISMDLTLVDVSSIRGVQTGDEVLLLGNRDALSVTAPDLARHCHTVPYEILCGISKRVPRIYTQ